MVNSLGNTALTDVNQSHDSLQVFYVTIGYELSTKQRTDHKLHIINLKYILRYRGVGR